MAVNPVDGQGNAMEGRSGGAAFLLQFFNIGLFKGLRNELDDVLIEEGEFLVFLVVGAGQYNDLGFGPYVFGKLGEVLEE